MSKIRIELRTNLTNKDGKAPLRLIYQISGDRGFYAPDPKILLHPANWDLKSQTIIYLTKKDAKKGFPGLDFNLNFLDDSEVETRNTELAVLTKEIKDIESDFERAGKKCNVADVIKILNASKAPTTQKQEPNQLLFDFIDKYIAEHQSTRVKGSLTVYKSVKNHLQNYQASTRDKVRFDNIDYSFFQRFQTYLINHTTLSNTTIAKAISTLKTFLGYARKQGIKFDDSYRDFIIRKEKLEVIALTSEEFQSLLDIDLTESKRLDRVRDVFCFSCATGLRYSDLSKLTRSDIGVAQINIIVTKTRTELTIPLNAISSEILHKYKDHHKPLPVISGQNTNLYIKELCELAKINSPVKIVRFKGTIRTETEYPKYKLIHIHTGRKTFCTLSLEKGMSAEQVMGISGHLDYKSFKRYVDVTEKLKKVAMAKAWGEFKLIKVV